MERLPHKELYRSFWIIQEMIHKDGKLWFHIYRLPSRKFYGQKKSVRKCQRCIDQLLEMEVA